jgi:hypothetical protein
MSRRVIQQAHQVLIAQHKPFSYLSPSTTPKGNKHFAIDLLTAKNRQGGSWHGAVEPRLLPGLNCVGGCAFYRIARFHLARKHRSSLAQVDWTPIRLG